MIFWIQMWTWSRKFVTFKYKSQTTLRHRLTLAEDMHRAFVYFYLSIFTILYSSNLTWFSLSTLHPFILFIHLWCNKTGKCLDANAPITSAKKMITPRIYLVVGKRLMKDQTQRVWIRPSSNNNSSVVQSCPTFCDPMNCSMPGPLSITNSWSSPKLMSIESVMPFGHRNLCRPLLLLPPMPPASESFPMSQLFTWGGKSTGVSASATFPPKKSQGWSPSEWSGWISLQSKGPQLKSISSSALSLLHSPTLTSIHDYWKNHSLD